MRGPFGTLTPPGGGGGGKAALWDLDPRSAASPSIPPQHDHNHPPRSDPCLRGCLEVRFLGGGGCKTRAVWDEGGEGRTEGRDVQGG